MDNKDFSDIGKQIKNAVQDAVNSKDFSELNRQIADTVNSALDELNQQLRRGKEVYSSKKADENSEAARRRRQAEVLRRRREIELRQARAHRQNEERRLRAARSHVPVLVNRHPAGSVSQVLCTVFGSIGLSLGLIAAMVVGIVGLTVNVASVVFPAVSLGIIVPVVAGSSFLLGKGISDRRKIQRFRRYASLLKDRTYCTVKELAAAVGKDNKFVIKDIKRMIRFRMFPQGHLDDDEEYFIISDETYRQYQITQKNAQERRRIRQEEDPLSRELRETTEKGEKYLKAIADANDAIPGEEISEKLYQLERTVRRIFEQVKKNPAQLPELRKFMEYYLPTTLKLVETYKEFDAQPIAGSNITSAKKEIEDTLDTINQAFENLFDSLFENTAMDISTDISVLETMLAQEGLTGGDFK